MLPSILAKQLQKGIGDYIETTFPMTNEPFKGSVQKMLANKGSVYHEPYVAVRLPFRVAAEMPTCFEAIHPAYLPYVHQQKAFERLTGDDGRSTLVATGTGSGKTECFLYPILEYCYQHRGERGIKALIIYPMNALATDQAKRIAELIYGSEELRGNVSVGMYVGGQEHTPARMMSEHGVITDHETMLNNAPDILMTNYKMLDYLLVRPKDALLWRDNEPETLKYIAVDELHTFDGAQGTDLACLLRRLKRRLGIYDGYLCCVGTSATMGSKENDSNILNYAEEIFGEPFDKDAIITEDRLSAQEFFAGAEVTEFALPTVEQAIELEKLSEEDEPSAYLQSAVKDWFPDFSFDVLDDEGRIQLGYELMHHSFMQSVINLTGGAYYQASKIAEELNIHYPDLKDLPDATVVINSLFALISHARTGKAGRLRPFLNVQVQLWMRELRRVVAKVDPDEITYEIANDLNKQQAKQYLPVVNCRDCGITGWVSVLNERSNATMTNLESFYNLYFRADEKIVMMFPHSHDERISGMIPARICPDCLQVKLGEDGTDECFNCGAEMVDVMIPNPIKTSGTKNHKQYVCPCCGSRRGLSLMGLRSATEISASLSQMFASKFNDDKKTLAFSDNVQDAAHRAGFFNSRTWRFGLRTAIQKYCTEKGSGQNLADFQNGFIEYWHEHMTDEQFVSFFIAPNLTWKQAYEDMVEKRSLGKDKQAQILVYEVEQRIKYEIMLEFGLAGNIGRTLEKSNCSVISFIAEDIIQIADAVQERTINELGVLTTERLDSFKRMVIGYLNLMRTNGAFEDKVFDEYTRNDGNGYMLSNDRNRWLPGRQSGRNTPRFIAEHIGNGRSSFEFDSPSANKYVDWIASCCNELMVEDSNFRAISKFILDEAVKRNLISLVPSSVNYKIYGLNKERVFITDDVMQMRCDKCGSVYAIAAENAELWVGAPCQRTTCGGFLEKYDTGEINYYGRLYSAGDLVRINAREHTGLLERPNREQLEIDFKRGKDTQKIWDPNVLSCTPTLEMGIDIGDLSTVILCSMPPAQSQFLQRAGRAGRKDGNALTLAVANARPHDLYFYSDPLEMIAGEVTPPKIFLRASAVLERQFVAFCMDSWVKKGIPDGAIPDKVGIVLKKLDARPDDMFPFNFLNYVQSTLSRQLNSFMQMFAAYLDDSAREELQMFARGKDANNSPMYVKILDAFEDLKKQQDALKTSVDALKAMIHALENKPKDSSYDEEIKELKREEAALLTVLQEIGKKNIFNFLSDEGLLPNYAFPEAGIILRAVLYRKEDEETPVQKKRYEKMVYEYSRSASSAISEFAPNNSFYVDGRKLTIVVVDGEDELRRIMAEPLEKWRVFLHPTQRKIVQKEYSGSARVLGGAGTGKTVVAMHRAKHLASKCEGQQRILVTTFTANLAADIRENLRKICTLEELRRIEVIHLDAWVNQFLRESGFSAQIGYDDVINPLWEKAVLSANIDLPFETSFYEEEWNRIAIAQEALTLEKYVRATRNGRGTRLDRKKRMQVWKVFENYQNLMKENQIRDINTAMYESTKLLQSVGRKPRYASIIIDEGQDFSDNAYRLIRALAGEEHPNDIFIVGDSHQRIYRNHPTLSKCGINVRGRSSILKINYRTTEEIRKYAFALLNGISFDDLDENSDLGDKCQSLTHGEKPIVENFENANDEFDFLLHEVKKLKENGISLTDICVVARTKKLVDDYIALFTKAGICAYVIKRNKVDDRSFDGLRVATMHRVKGLEFKYVFIVAANSRIIPLPSAINKTDPVSEVESVTSEKCLLYVAMTRAQKGVYITSYGRKSVFLKS